MIYLSTIIYLVRHGKTDKSKLIDVKDDGELIGHTEVDLDESFIPEIKDLSKRLELERIKNVYSSNYIRTKKTAQILSNNKEIKTDKRLGERKGGIPNVEMTKEEFYKKQFDDPTFKFPEGESSGEIMKRTKEAIIDILKENKNEETLVVSHGFAITFLLKNWCDIELLDAARKIRRFKFKGKIIHEGVVNFIQCFKLIFDENETLENIEII